MVSRVFGSVGRQVLVHWAKQRVLVTGAAGFIGQRLVQRLVDAGAQVYAGVAPDENPEQVDALPTQAQRLRFDLRDAKAVQAAVVQAVPQIIIHLAAVGATNPGVDPVLALAVNAGGALHLLDALKQQASKDDHTRRVVLVGTCYEYGARKAREGVGCFDPFNTYAASKVAAWAFGRAYWREHGLPTVTVRPFQVYGPGQASHTLISAAVRAALAGNDFSMTLGEQQRDFIYVDDIVEGMLAAATSLGIEGHSLDLGTGHVHLMREVIERIWTMTSARGRIMAGALPYRSGEVMHLVADADHTARLTGWRAQVGLEEGLRCTIETIKVDGK
ncbi:MAG: NAD(P)-dependent oxidoreductase [Chloroflexi bacterium]|nr:NAD(P)-dependent oxidoreductase [Chloroflexota bacterium]